MKIKLFVCIRKFLCAKLHNSKKTFLNSDCNFKSLIDLIKNAVTIKEIKRYVNLCIKNNITTFSNYYIIINFYIYVMDIDFSNECFDLEIVLEFLFIESSGKKQSTANRFKNNLLSFVNKYHGAHGCDYLKIHLPKYIYYKPPMSVLYMLNHEEVEEVFTIMNFIKLKNRKIDILMINILLRTGIRVTEMLNIELKNIIYENDIICIKIRGKNNFYRVISLLPQFTSLMKDIGENNTKWLFENNGKQFTRQYVYYLVKKILKKAGIHKFKNGPHILRHTFASRLYEKYKDIVLVQEALGHRNINTTINYIHVNKEALLEMTKVYD